jgi:hypothetical protein
LALLSKRKKPALITAVLNRPRDAEAELGVIPAALPALPLAMQRGSDAKVV